jgi:hypothetical protein
MSVIMCEIVPVKIFLLIYFFPGDCIDFYYNFFRNFKLLRASAGANRQHNGQRRAYPAVDADDCSEWSSSAYVDFRSDLFADSSL